MTDSVRLPQEAAGAASAASGQRPQQHAPERNTATFRHALLHAVQSHRAAKGTAPASVHQVVARVPAPAVERPGATLPVASSNALDKAMTLEGVPASWQSGLSFIMEKESGGRVGIKSPIHSARGLYQLTAANYHYNPRGAASFGNAVEEAQGGIRYIRARYGSAENAAAFWRKHGWY